MGTEQIRVWSVRVSENAPRLPEKFFRGGYFDYKGMTYRIGERRDFTGWHVSQEITDPEIIAYAKTLWELSK